MHIRIMEHPSMLHVPPRDMSQHYLVLTSQPWKLQSLPLVQTPSTPNLLTMVSTMVFSSGVSTDTRSMHMCRQMFRASSQPTYRFTDLLFK